MRRWTTRANGVSWPVQRGAAALYSREGRAQTEAVIDHYMTNARMLREGCETLGWQAFGGENAPFVWVACPRCEDSWTFFERILHEAQVVITPGLGFGRLGEGFIRISAFNHRDRIEEVVERLRGMC
jgi:LL-diaminopimelate aminotransferase